MWPPMSPQGGRLTSWFQFEPADPDPTPGSRAGPRRPSEQGPLGLSVTSHLNTKHINVFITIIYSLVVEVVVVVSYMCNHNCPEAG